MLVEMYVILLIKLVYFQCSYYIYSFLTIFTWVCTVYKKSKMGSEFFFVFFFVGILYPQ